MRQGDLLSKYYLSDVKFKTEDEKKQEAYSAYRKKWRAEVLILYPYLERDSGTKVKAESSSNRL